MLRHMLVLTALTVFGLQAMASAESLPVANDGGGPLKLEQGHPGQDPSAPADIGNTSIQALASGAGGGAASLAVHNQSSRPSSSKPSPTWQKTSRILWSED